MNEGVNDGSKIRSFLEAGLGAFDPVDLLSLAELERRHIHRVLDAVGGNKSIAARILGIDRKTLYRKIGREVAHPRKEA